MKKIILLILILTITSIAAGYLIYNSAIAESKAEQIKIENTDIRDVAQIVADRTGKNFIVSSEVNAKVNFISGRSSNPVDIYDEFLKMLDVEGLAIEKHEDTIIIIPKAKKDLVPVGINGTSVVKLHYLNAEQTKNSLTEMAVQSNTGIMSLEDSNSLIITGKPENIKTMQGIIEAADKPSNYKTETFYCINGDAKEIADTIKAAMPKETALAANERTNSIVFSGDDNQRGTIKAALETLDGDTKAPERNKVLPLKYANAEDMAETLNKMATNKGVLVVPDKKNNSLIVTGTRAEQDSIQKIIAALDQRNPQVLVEAIVADVSDELTQKLGTSLANNNGASQFGGIESIAGIYGALGERKLANIPTGLLLAGKEGSLDIIFNALKSDSETNIISTPSLVTLDNQEASIVVGQEVPFKTGTSTATNGTTTDQIERKDVGITFKITPQINRDKTVKLAITQEVSSISTAAGASDLITNKRQINTNVMVNDGEIIVLGGLVEESNLDSQDKTPVLGDIPLLGNLFKKSTKTAKKTNLMLFIHPVILPDPDSANEYTRKKHRAIVQQVTPSPEQETTPPSPEPVTPEPKHRQEKKCPYEEDQGLKDLLC